MMASRPTTIKIQAYRFIVCSVARLVLWTGSLRRGCREKFLQRGAGLGSLEEPARELFDERPGPASLAACYFFFFGFFFSFLMPMPFATCSPPFVHATLAAARPTMRQSGGRRNGRGPLLGLAGSCLLSCSGPPASSAGR